MKDMSDMRREQARDICSCTVLSSGHGVFRHGRMRQETVVTATAIAVRRSRADWGQPDSAGDVKR